MNDLANAFIFSTDVNELIFLVSVLNTGLIVINYHLYVIEIQIYELIV